MYPGGPTMYNYIIGGSGGAGGGGYERGVGGAGGYGMGPSLNFDICPIGNFTMNNNVWQGERGIDIMHRTVALEAIHNSAESYPQPRCHPETRTRMLKDLRDWTSDPDSETTVLWLYGPAGVGKSAIMQTLAGQLKDAGVLGGSFFFKRGHATRGNAKTLFTTVAYQLALSVPSLRAPISQIVESDPSIVALSIEVQMQNVISKPSRSNWNFNQDSIIILIDGLDECEGHNIQVQILRLIQQSSSQDPSPLGFIIASRPEPHICQVFDSSSFHYRPFNIEQSFHDVRKYLRDEFSRIHRDHLTMQNVSLPWPEYNADEEDNTGLASELSSLADDNLDDPAELESLRESLASFSSATSVPSSIDLQTEEDWEDIDMDDDTEYGDAAVYGNFKLSTDVLAKIHTCIKEVSLPTWVARLPDNLGKKHGKLKAEQYLTLFAAILPLVIPETPLTENEETSEKMLQGFSDLAACTNIVASFEASDSEAEAFTSHYIAYHKHVQQVFPDCKEPPNFHYAMHNEALLKYWGPLPGVAITSWLENLSAPADVIQLWEDYAFMFSINIMDRHSQGPSVKHDVLPSPELVRILVSMGFLCCRLWELPTKLDLTWTDLRTTLCSLRPKSVGDEHTLPIHQLQTTSSLWAARDLVLELIRKMVTNHIDSDKGVKPSASRHAVWMYNVYPYICDLEKAYITSQSVSIMQKDNFIDHLSKQVSPRDPYFISHQTVSSLHGTLSWALVYPTFRDMVLLPEWCTAETHSFYYR
ncbi:putative nwd2 protein [Mycena sanguinolenta]|uniref:Putative nwd2 protein n=1 Tax=Mycena sanguinolenta TaxID=230812 RepID=A0A8H6Z9T9_9AGAR|nr:putative nwd2 protein [Mycena sanguinolenta]